MKSDEKDIPISSDYKKSQENKGPQIPDFLTSKFGAIIGLGVVVLVVGLIYGIGHIDFSRPVPNPLEANPGFASLKQHVENLAEVDHLCSTASDRDACLCELSDRIRNERRAIDTILASNPGLQNFAIEIRKPASVTYNLKTLPQIPAEATCLNAVAAPTIIDEESPAQ